MATERPRFTITVSEEMLRQIDDFRFTNRYSTRTTAVNELLRLGLEAYEKQQSQAAQKK